MNAIFAPAGALEIDFAGSFLSTEGARAGFMVLAGMLVSFGFIRMSTRLMRSPKVPWWPGSVTPGGLHIHHLVFGIVMMMVAGFLMFAFQPESPWLEILAASFGIGVGLTLDEFALWLYLDDVYWAEEGRRSVDAIIVATILAGGIAIGLAPLGADGTDGSSLGLVLTILINLGACVVTAFKGKIWMAIFGLFIPFVGEIGAIRLAKPNSPYARRFYKPGSRRERRAEARQHKYDKRAARYQRWQDRIGGAPSIFKEKPPRSSGAIRSILGSEMGPGRGIHRGALAILLAVVALAAVPAGASAKRDFPKSFQWGVATAGFQSEMGRGRDLDRRSDWFAWTHDSDNIADGTVTADRPEDGPGFFARYRGDVNLAASDLHLKAFRLGIEWSRIFPRSTRKADTLKQLDKLANHNALRKYRRILAYIHARGLNPWVTMSHFTLPIWIQDPIAARDAFNTVGPDDPPPDGFGPRGWLDRSTVTEFRKYASYLSWKLGDQVNRWITLNEPMVVAVNGYVNIPGLIEGNFPPAAYNFPAVITVIERLAQANAKAYDAVHRQDPGSKVGFVHNMIAFTPANPASALDRQGSNHAWYVFDRLFLDEALKGYRDHNADGAISPGERDERRAGKADFVGVNYYFRGRVTGLPAPITPSIPVLDFVPATSYQSPTNPTGAPCPTTCSDFGNELYPQGFRQVLRVAGSYGRPLVVTENGISDADDDQRPGFLRSHLAAMSAAMRAGADVRGYFHWSLTDNFEWSVGYTQRFGLYGYDPETLKRSARPSAKLFGRVAKTGRLP